MSLLELGRVYIWVVDGNGGYVYGPNGTSWHVSFLKPAPLVFQDNNPIRLEYR